MFQRGKLIRESEWMRVYECQYESQKGMHHESKFLTDRIRVSADSIIGRWSELSFEEKNEFANAFAVKPEVTPEDERILNFLMEQGDFYIWMGIAPLLPSHRDRDRALAFLEERVRQRHADKANFFQALELMGDKRAIPALRAAYDAYKAELATPNGPPKSFDYFDYLACCRALWILESSAEYKDAIQALVQNGDPRISASARQALRIK